jgi:hypothetical protein
MLPGLVTLLAALCAAQCSFWHALLQYSTLLHALHSVRPPLGKQEHVALASPGRACARTGGSGARRRAALSRAGRKRDGLRRDRHGRGVGEELVALELDALGALSDQRRDGGFERSSRA